VNLHVAFQLPRQALLKHIILSAFGAVLSVSGSFADEFGLATYYQNPNHGGMIAAHRTLPFGTRVRVYNLENSRSAVVVIVDRGPFARGRVIDVSTIAADALGMRQAGVVRVRLELLNSRDSDLLAARQQVIARLSSSALFSLRLSDETPQHWAIKLYPWPSRE
jgi:rare lipoprotein A